jgi:phage terminase large subunit GpA-like protein
MKVAQSMIDAGGHRTTEVLRWAKLKSPRVYPIRGQGGKGHAIIKNRNTSNEIRVPQIIVGVDGVKAELHTRLSVEEPGPAYYHFPKNKDGSDAMGFNEEFFKQLTSERCTFRYVRGTPKEEWVIDGNGTRRNEAFDCAVYGFAALENYCGSIRPNDMLVRLARDRENPNAPKFVPKWQTNVPADPVRPLPVQIASAATATTPAEPKKFVPRWRTPGNL